MQKTRIFFFFFVAVWTWITLVLHAFQLDAPFGLKRGEGKIVLQNISVHICLYRCELPNCSVTEREPGYTLKECGWGRAVGRVYPVIDKRRHHFVEQFLEKCLPAD